VLVAPAEPHVVAVLALPGVVGFDLPVPCQVFGTTLLAGGGRPARNRPASTIHIGC
jgi:hypothetical protein